MAMLHTTSTVPHRAARSRSPLAPVAEMVDTLASHVVARTFDREQTQEEQPIRSRNQGDIARAQLWLPNCDLASRKRSARDMQVRTLPGAFKPPGRAIASVSRADGRITYCWRRGPVPSERDTISILHDSAAGRSSVERVSPVGTRQGDRPRHTLKTGIESSGSASALKTWRATEVAGEARILFVRLRPSKGYAPRGLPIGGADGHLTHTF